VVFVIVVAIGTTFCGASKDFHLHYQQEIAMGSPEDSILSSSAGIKSREQSKNIGQLYKCPKCQ
jgi:hypothetical protein